MKVKNPKDIHSALHIFRKENVGRYHMFTKREIGKLVQNSSIQGIAILTTKRVQKDRGRARYRDTYLCDKARDRPTCALQHKKS